MKVAIEVMHGSRYNICMTGVSVAGLTYTYGDNMSVIWRWQHLKFNFTTAELLTIVVSRVVVGLVMEEEYGTHNCFAILFVWFSIWERTEKKSNLVLPIIFVFS